MKKIVLALSVCALLAGCATSQPANISGNGGCRPSQDLPATKVMKKVPEAETSLEDLWALFARERKDHGADVRDYNSLYKQCVGDKGA